LTQRGGLNQSEWSAFGEMGDRDTDRPAALQQAYLERCAPGFRVRQVRWSKGATAVIEGGAGPPLLLVHGGGGDAFQWGPILPLLASHYRVIAVDRPGHGLSDPFDYRGVDLFAHADAFLGDLLHGEGLSKAVIAGNSMGGLFSLALALRNPERIEHLWLVGVPGGLTRQLPLTARLPAVPVLGGFVRRMIKNPTRERILKFWGRALVRYPQRLREDFLDVEVAMTRRNAPSIISLLDRFLDLRGVAPDLVLGPRWDAIHAPATFVIGEYDRGARLEEVEAIVARNPRFRLVKLADVGHVPWVDNPESVAQAMGVG
jgi:pimeloyl-ACP methyl ester carboxylesterase